VSATIYAERADLYKYGLPRGNLGLSARECGKVDTASNSIELDGHGFEDGEAVVFRPCEGESLPAPLVEGTTYYAKRVNHTRFAVSVRRGIAALDITSIGAAFFVATELPFAEVLEYYSRWVDDLLPAHAVPLTCPLPVQITATVAELAAKKLMHLAGHQSDSVDEFEIAAKAKLERWSAGMVLRDVKATTAHTNLAITSAPRTADRSLP
jgi:hypothetical protein